MQESALSCFIIYHHIPQKIAIRWGYNIKIIQISGKPMSFINDSDRSPLPQLRCARMNPGIGAAPSSFTSDFSLFNSFIQWMRQGWIHVFLFFLENREDFIQLSKVNGMKRRVKIHSRVLAKRSPLAVAKRQPTADDLALRLPTQTALVPNMVVWRCLKHFFLCKPAFLRW